MKVIGLVKNLFLVGAVFLGIQESSASSAEDIVCPTVEQLKQLKLLYAGPVSFDQKSQKVNFSVHASETFDFPFHSGWSLVIDNMQAGKGEDFELIFNATRERLEPFSSEPFQYSINNYFGEEKSPECIYTVPGYENIQAFASYHEAPSNSLKLQYINKHLHGFQK